jgi:ABC-type spermidine/putrescine transport system permease subunit I
MAENRGRVTLRGAGFGLCPAFLCLFVAYFVAYYETQQKTQNIPVRVSLLSVFHALDMSSSMW